MAARQKVWSDLSISLRGSDCLLLSVRVECVRKFQYFQLLPKELIRYRFIVYTRAKTFPKKKKMSVHSLFMNNTGDIVQNKSTCVYYCIFKYPVKS